MHQQARAWLWYTIKQTPLSHENQYPSCHTSLGYSHTGPRAVSRSILHRPETSNGYFIVNAEKAQSLDLDRVEIKIMAAELLPSGAVDHTVVESLTITDGFYAQADLGLLQGLTHGEVVYYTFTGYDAMGTVVIDGSDRTNGEPVWPAICEETCDARWYAWTLTAYSDDVENSIYIKRGTRNGEALRVYIRPGINPNTNVSYLLEFEGQFNPSEHFGFGTYYWSTLQSQPNQDDMILINPVPPDARDYQGYALGNVSGPVWAVKKGLGPWQGLARWTENFSNSTICTGGDGELLTQYNADPGVQGDQIIQTVGPLTCEAYLAAGGGLSWGSGYECEGYVVVETEPGVGNTVDVGEFTLSYYGCVYLSYATDAFPMPVASLEDVSSVSVLQWARTAKTEVLNIAMPTVKDPKLVPVPKTVLNPGLYEFMIVLKNGEILSHFHEFRQQVALQADFASFTQVNIYPVPVKEKNFAIDFDLLTPMDIELTIVNNTGVPYYTRSLEFALPGRNKHVVTMASDRPQGIYHAVFNYSDGSSSSRSFTVQY